jgi:hypothetical protein
MSTTELHALLGNMTRENYATVKAALVEAESLPAPAYRQFVQAVLGIPFGGFSKGKIAAYSAAFIERLLVSHCQCASI